MSRLNAERQKPEIRHADYRLLAGNEVETIENQAQKLEALIPEARIQVAHGQLRELDRERIMRG